MGTGLFLHAECAELWEAQSDEIFTVGFCGFCVRYYRNTNENHKRIIRVVWAKTSEFSWFWPKLEMVIICINHLIPIY